MQANKNGFFYVLDRATGELLSAKTFTYINWASGVDMKTGRPVTTPQSDWYTSPKNIYPAWSGAHTWNPMSLSGHDASRVHPGHRHAERLGEPGAQRRRP